MDIVALQDQVVILQVKAHLIPQQVNRATVIQVINQIQTHINQGTV